MRIMKYNGKEIKKPEPENLISLRAMMILTLALTTNIPLSVEYLYPHFSEGRDAITSALRELRECDLIRLSRVHINGYWVAANKITQRGRNVVLSRLNIEPREGFKFAIPVDLLDEEFEKTVQGLVEDGIAQVLPKAYWQKNQLGHITDPEHLKSLGERRRENRRHQYQRQVSDAFRDRNN